MKVGVIMGGISSEREISIQSGNSVVHALDKDKYEAIPIVLNEKEWSGEVMYSSLLLFMERLWKRKK